MSHIHIIEWGLATLTWWLAWEYAIRRCSRLLIASSAIPKPPIETPEGICEGCGGVLDSFTHPGATRCPGCGMIAWKTAYEIT
jgi:hypothetical protein